MGRIASGKVSMEGELVAVGASELPWEINPGQGLDFGLAKPGSNSAVMYDEDEDEDVDEDGDIFEDDDFEDGEGEEDDEFFEDDEDLEGDAEGDDEEGEDDDEEL